MTWLPGKWKTQLRIFHPHKIFSGNLHDYSSKKKKKGRKKPETHEIQVKAPGSSLRLGVGHISRRVYVKLAYQGPFVTSPGTCKTQNSVGKFSSGIKENRTSATAWTRSRPPGMTSDVLWIRADATRRRAKWSLIITGLDNGFGVPRDFALISYRWFHALELKYDNE